MQMMNVMKILCTLALLCGSVAFAENVQLSTPRDTTTGIHYGLPGWVNLDDTHLGKLPSSGLLKIPVSFPISYAGKEYQGLTVNSKGWVYLGNLSDTYQELDFGTGSRPYVVPTIRDYKAFSDQGISVRWSEKTDSDGSRYAVVEVDSISFLAGSTIPYSYQVLVYEDGEIQIHFWKNNPYEGSIASIMKVGANGHAPVFTDMGESYVYTSASLLKTNVKYSGMSKKDTIFYNEIRPGWVAKSFDGYGVVLSYVDSKDVPNKKDLLVNFGNHKAAGGLIAYDEAREHPLTGGVSFLDVNAEYESPEGQRDSIDFWYFNETISESYKASYPFFSGYRWGSNLSNHAKCFDNDVIWPCAYVSSWQVAIDANVDYEKIPAPAIKFQVWDHSNNTVLRIKSIYLGQFQPKSLRFLPPPQRSLSVNMNGKGYAVSDDVQGASPYSILQDKSVFLRLYPNFGLSISSISINGVQVIKDGTQLVSSDVNDPLYYYSSLISVGTDGIYEFRASMIMDFVVSVEFGACERNLPAVTPAYTKTQIFETTGASGNTVTLYSVKDGLGRTVQTQTQYDGNIYGIETTYLDAFGNEQMSLKGYRKNKSSYSFEDMACYGCVIASAAYYDGRDSLEHYEAYGFPYSQVNRFYGNDNGIVTSSNGLGMLSAAYRSDVGKQWRLPLATATVSDFLSKDQLNEDDLRALYALRKAAIASTSYDYALLVSRDMEGRFVQTIVDAEDNVLFVWADDGTTISISANVYDEYDRIIKSYLVDYPEFKTTMEYDDAGRILKTTSNDRGVVETMYDSLGRARFTRNSRDLALGTNYFQAIVYDSLGRPVRKGEVRGGHSFDSPNKVIAAKNIHLNTETIYGKPTLDKLISIGVTTDSVLLQNILDSMSRVRPFDVGVVIGYDLDGEPMSLKLSGYDRMGRTHKSWLIYDEGAPPSQIENTYNEKNMLASQVFSEWKTSIWNTAFARDYIYDQNSSLVEIQENKKKALLYERNGAGIIAKTHYYDENGNEIYSGKVDRDIYGRTLKLGYAQPSGTLLYSQKLEYVLAGLSRVASSTHLWNGVTSVEESFSYDAVGRLVSSKSTNGAENAYSFDTLGRLSSKSEGNTLLAYSYADASYQPESFSVNGGEASQLVEYDPAGAIFLDRHASVAYRNNRAGLPYMAYSFGDVGAMSGLTWDGVSSTNTYATRRMDYDESGSHVRERTSWISGNQESETEIPGIGIYKRSTSPSGVSTESMARRYFPGGGYRLNGTGTVYRPLLDAQGSVRGYATNQGLVSAYGYQPYGTIVELKEESGTDASRWQSQEFEGWHGKYRFGARYYDPFFGMWASPDPAGQFANPYSYGGDPVGYVDPTGMWALGLGLVVGYDSKQGWSYGVGASADFGSNKWSGSVNASYTWNQDGSNTLDIGSSGSYQVWIINLSGGMSYNYNTYTGHTLSQMQAICFGAGKDACAGVQSGQSLSWDTQGNFLGGAVYQEVYATAGNARISTGYEEGVLGGEGRGWYAGASAYGLHSQYAQNGGWSYGGQEQVYLGYGNNTGKQGADGKTGSVVSAELWLPTLGKYGHFAFGETYDVSREGLNNVQRNVLTKLGVDSKDIDLLYSYADKKGDEAFKRIQKKLSEQGYEIVNRPNGHGDGNEKITYKLKGAPPWRYGNIEFIKAPKGDRPYIYSSYNYGGNWATHFIIDFIGWEARENN